MKKAALGFVAAVAIVGCLALMGGVAHVVQTYRKASALIVEVEALKADPVRFFQDQEKAAEGKSNLRTDYENYRRIVVWVYQKQAQEAQAQQRAQQRQSNPPNMNVPNPAPVEGAK